MRMSNQIIDPGRWVGDEGEPDSAGPAEAQGITRRRMVGYLVAAPILTIAVKFVDDLVRIDAAEATPGVPDIFDLTDALTLAAQPTMMLLVVEVTPQNRVIVHLPRAEVGQGLTTSCAQIVADELGASLSDVEVVLDDARPELLFNQLTGGSNSIHALFEPMRIAAANVRSRLITAAAQLWGVAATTLRTGATAVTGPVGQSATFGALTAAAAGVVTPLVPATLKNPADFTLIGRSTNRVDARDIVTGRARYTLDLDVPGAMPTVVARAPTIGGTVASVNDAAARAMPGVIAVTRIATGVAVTAQTFDQALKARDALTVTWNAGPMATLSDAQISSQLRAAALPFVVPPLGTLAIDRTFDFAFVPHAPLETLNCIADVQPDRAEIWFPSKSPIVALQRVAEAVGLPQHKVTLHVIRARWVVRPPAVLRLCHRGGADLEGHRPTGQTALDPRRRHAPRPHATRQPSQDPRHPPARQRADVRTSRCRDRTGRRSRSR